PADEPVVFEGEGGAASWMSAAWDPAGAPTGAPIGAPSGAPIGALIGAPSGEMTAPGLAPGEPQREIAGAAGKIEVADRTELVAAYAAIGGEGVLGRMVDLVGFADGYEGVGKRLLGSTVVVDDLDRALQLHTRGVADRLVTLDGDLVEHDGVVAGG